MELLTPENLSVLIKLVVAVLLGSTLGLERTLAHKTAGMRTYALVTMGAALFVIVAQTVADKYLAAGIRGFDPLHTASQVIAGIGFIGAGLIIFKDDKLFGLTTAAGLWVAAGIGLAVGYALYPVAIVATIITLLVFTALWFIEQRLNGGTTH
jgi:putative Mg2+ transporter-C (MgtC) family protein